MSSWNIVYNALYYLTKLYIQFRDKLIQLNFTQFFVLNLIFVITISSEISLKEEISYGVSYELPKRS